MPARQHPLRRTWRVCTWATRTTNTTSCPRYSKKDISDVNHGPLIPTAHQHRWLALTLRERGKLPRKTNFRTSVWCCRSKLETTPTNNFLRRAQLMWWKVQIKRKEVSRFTKYNTVRQKGNISHSASILLCAALVAQRTCNFRCRIYLRRHLCVTSTKNHQAKLVQFPQQGHPVSNLTMKLVLFKTGQKSSDRNLIAKDDSTLYHCRDLDKPKQLPFHSKSGLAKLNCTARVQNWKPGISVTVYPF